MPNRPRSHQLEDLSKLRFLDLLPRQWVTRVKSPDYGIDLEVEIFDEQGHATGLTFQVQLRATDDPAKSQQLTLERDQHEYFFSLDVPTILVRYCATDESFHWRWHFEIPHTREGYKSQTVRFKDSDRWATEMPRRIESALRTWRLMRRHPLGAPVSIELDVAQLPPAERYRFEAVIRELTQETPVLTLTPSPAIEVLAVSITAMPASITVAIGELSSIALEHDGIDYSRLQSSLLYTIAVVLGRAGLARHADLVARRCLALGIPHTSAELAVEAAQAIGSSAVLAAKLAILNGVHLGTSPHHMLFSAYLLAWPHDRDERNEALRLYFEAAIQSAADAGDAKGEGLLHYSYGNFHANNYNNPEAIRSFNKARRLYPPYLETQYFLEEVGGALFGQRRYAAAARWYRRAAELEYSQRLALYLGDALLLSGQAQEAAEAYQGALAGESAAIAAEAEVKLAAANWLRSRHGPSFVRLASVARSALRETSDVATCRMVLEAFDSLDETANFNVGVAEANTGHFFDALNHFLICVIVCSGDEESWTNALLSALNTHDPRTLQLMLKCALTLGGAGMADGLRARFAESGAEDLLEKLDQAIGDISAELAVARPAGVTFRMVHGPEK